MNQEKIDFVILWVDGNDKNWIAEKNNYTNIKGDKNINRFRDWDNLQYLFRGIDKYANWVNKIFFVTWGHVPSWLDTNNPKIRVVNHKEFIPSKYLPTFNSNVIEMNLFRIKDLSEKFVLLNDDLFILKETKPSDFFKNDLPIDMYVEYLKKNCSRRHTILKNNYLSIINKYFRKEETIKNNISKVFNINYGLLNFKTLLTLKYGKYQDFFNNHLNKNFLKSAFEEVWNKEYDILDEFCNNKFRADSDIGQTLIRVWQLLKGNFYPKKSNGKYFCVLENNNKLIKCIIGRKYKIICINDAYLNIDFIKSKNEINKAFEKIFPEKSSFEK